jgi:hypothetical protein
MKLYTKIFRLCVAIENCQVSGHKEWELRHIAELNELIKEKMPNGSGFDNRTLLLGCDNRVMFFETRFHHMDENGFYDGWTDHKITVKPGFDGVEIKVGGVNRNDIKDHIAECFYHALNEEIGE